MRLDHVSYVASHDQISDVVNRIGSQIGTAFVDGGIHPKFGTRNFTAPLLNGQYIEIVCPLDHPATDATPFGQAVKKKAEAGGGWLTWVFSVSDISLIETKLGRTAIEGQRTLPTGVSLTWKQIGVKEIIDFKHFPFFIEWLSQNHPSQDGLPISKIVKISIADKTQLQKSVFKDELINSLGEIKIEWENYSVENYEAEIVSVAFLTPTGEIWLD